MIYIFTGAGCSADSGLPTFRDSGGLWENYKIEEVCSLPNFMESQETRDKTFEFYNARKLQYADAQPHAGHHAITALQQRTPVKVLTTNIDNLHELAGTVDVTHLHGSMFKMNCAHCYHEWDIGLAQFVPVACESCDDKKTKPGVVFFGEHAPEYSNYYKTIDAMTEDDTFIIVGASLQVLDPISALRRRRHKKPPRIIMVDANPNWSVGMSDYPVVECLVGSASQVLPELLGGLQ